LDACAPFVTRRCKRAAAFTEHEVATSAGRCQRAEQSSGEQDCELTPDFRYWPARAIFPSANA
jgi:hypothetical protein